MNSQSFYPARMDRPPFRALVICLLPILFLGASCADLTHLNTFSKTAVQALDTYDTIGYGYVYSFTEYTVDTGLYNFSDRSWERNIFPLKFPYQSQDTQAYAINARADAAIVLLYNSIGTYFSALTQASDKDLVECHFDSLIGPLKGDSMVLQQLHLTDTSKINAFGSVANAISHFLMGRYVERKLRGIIIQYDKDVQTTLGTFSDIIDGPLLGNLAADEQLVNIKYKQFLGNPYLSRDAKMGWINDYKIAFAHLEKKRLSLARLSTTLRKVGDDHHQLARQLQSDKLTDKKTQELLDGFTKDLGLRLQQIKTIK
jgi:hypothetical protein